MKSSMWMKMFEEGSSLLITKHENVQGRSPLARAAIASFQGKLPRYWSKEK